MGRRATVDPPGCSASWPGRQLEAFGIGEFRVTIPFAQATEAKGRRVAEEVHEALLMMFFEGVLAHLGQRGQ